MKEYIALALAVALLVLSLPSCKRNSPPDTPLPPVGSAACASGDEYIYEATATDPDGDSVCIRMDWGDTTQSIWSRLVASGETVAFKHTWNSLAVRHVRAQAKDLGELHSDWSEACSVAITARPTMPTGPFGPGHGRKDSVIAFGAAAYDPDGDSVAMRFLWAEGDTSDWSAFAGTGETVWLSRVWTAAGSYVVRAQARDKLGVFSLWSGAHLIVVKHDTLGKWRFRLTADSVPVYGQHSSPALGPDGTIYVGSADSAVYAVNPDGTLKWRYLTGEHIYSSPAIGPDGTVYVGSHDDDLYALNPDGSLKWRYHTTSYVASSPAIGADGTVYFGGNDGCYAVNPDGSLRWFVSNGVTLVKSSPAIAADGTIYFGATNDDCILALNPDSTLKWSFDTKEEVRGSPAIGADGSIYVGDEDSVFYAINPDGTMKWSYNTTDDANSCSPAIGPDGTIYAGGRAGLFALSPEGTLKWQYADARMDYAAPLIGADGAVYLGSTRGYFCCLNPDGTLRWKYELLDDDGISSSPAVGADGTTYFLAGDGYLYALRTKITLADSPWPKFHHDLRNSGRVGGR